MQHCAGFEPRRRLTSFITFSQMCSDEARREERPEVEPPQLLGVERAEGTPLLPRGVAARSPAAEEAVTSMLGVLCGSAS